MSVDKRKNSVFLKIGAIFLLFLFQYGYAKDLGVWGTVFPIAERDIREIIYEKLNQLQKMGAMEKINKIFLKNVEKHTLRPTPVAHLTVTEEPKQFYYDPIYILQKDIEDHEGKTIAKAGTTINPLDKIKLHGVLLFFNSDDKRQVKWAICNSKKYDYVRYILVQGSIKTATEDLGSRVYFDQYGLLTRQLKIEHIPCLVKQEGKRLKIEEFALKEGDIACNQQNLKKGER